MDKETLSNYGWIVICILVLSVMIALATPFGKFIAVAVENTTQGLFDVQQKAMGVAGLVVEDQKFENPNNNEGNNETLDNVIPEGGVYYVGVTSNKAGDYTGYTEKYEAGDTLPETVNENDVYVYNNYEYRYKKLYLFYGWGKASADGWGVRCINNVSNPGAILGSINSKLVTHMCYTFYCCDSLEVAPTIPDSVITIDNVFYGCSNLKTYEGSTDPNGDFSNYILPQSVTDISFAFGGCTLLTIAPYIPETVTTATQTFYSPPNNPMLTGKLYIPCHISDNTISSMYYNQCDVEVVRYCTSTCTGCANCNSECGH